MAYQKSTHLFILSSVMLMLCFVSCLGQIVDPARPSFSENANLVPAGFLQSENGAQMVKWVGQSEYSFNTVARTGIAKSWEARMFVSVASTKIRNGDGFSDLNIINPGAGIKKLILRETEKFPGFSLLGTISGRRLDVYSVNTVFSKSLGKLAVDANFLVTHQVNAPIQFGYILCIGYSFDKASLFVENFTTQQRNMATAHAIQCGLLYNIHARCKVDVALAAFVEDLTNQTVQLGISFLTPFKKNAKD